MKPRSNLVHIFLSFLGSQRSVQVFMMSCTCRATPLKIFVQGLSQVHKVEASPSLIRLPIRTPAARPALYQNNFAFARQARSLHFSTHLNQDASGEASKDTEPVVDIKSNDETSSVKDDNPLDLPETPDTSIPWKAQPGTNDVARRRRGKLLNPGDERGFKGVFNERAKGPPPGIPQVKENFWKDQKAALKEKFPEGWRPRKRLSPDALAGIRALNAQFPEVYTTAALAQKFEVSPEAIRRILRSKWQASPEEEESREERWFRRGKNVWEQKAALGIKPPQKWRREGVTRDPTYHVWRKDAVQRNRDWEERDGQETKGSYTPRKGAFAPRKGTYTPRNGTYTPRKGTDTSQKDTYTPRSGRDGS
ncbi:uncharacterized protein FTOL_02507 [Fusarium torulosum]|uniref:Required for respiratory growth protein 9, mitochondrial n=1 Tax=Fusarium torulosum TaxID=33205 RepID=A0AAE8SEG7_9HYPO|nr:uncharacterized protein FTOL_02507 [Fusarium torulosum]